MKFDKVNPFTYVLSFMPPAPIDDRYNLYCLLVELLETKAASFDFRLSLQIACPFEYVGKRLGQRSGMILRAFLKDKYDSIEQQYRDKVKQQNRASLLEAGVDSDDLDKVEELRK